MMSDVNSNPTITAEKPSLESPGSPVTDNEANTKKYDKNCVAYLFVIHKVKYG